MNSKEKAVKSFYTILSGVFIYEPKKIDETELFNQFENWWARLGKGVDIEKTREYYSNTYYDSYISNMYPELSDKNFRQSYDKTKLCHLTHSGTMRNEIILKTEIRGKEVNCKIPFFDIYLFPDGIGIFSLKVEIIDNNITIGLISDFLFDIRNLKQKILTNDETITVKELLECKLDGPLQLNNRWNRYIPQLKTYTQIDLKQDEIPEDEHNRLLYDLANMSPLGSADGVGSFAPSKTYFDEQMAENQISVFKNWSALTLFDTFTRISLDFEDKYGTWENDYFNIYLHSLYIRFFIYSINSEFNSVHRISKKAEQLRYKFISFVNHYNLSHISYKFLQNLLLKKMLFALDVDSEIDRMENKIQRINEEFQKKRDNRLNLVVSVLAVFGVFSVNSEISRWLLELNINIPHKTVYPIGSISILSIIFFTLFIALIVLRKK